jgi:hypothetical protein
LPWPLHARSTAPCNRSWAGACAVVAFALSLAEASVLAGIHEILRRQGLLAGRWCLDEREALSPGQRREIDRVCAAYPFLNDDAFVREHLDDWLR